MKHALILTLLAIASTAATRPDLKGKVLNADGKPIVGATALMYTAAVKHGVSPFCPSCYADCGKKAVTDADGTFTITSLDPELVFRVLVVADGYKPAFVKKVDPAGGAIEAKLTPLPSDLDPKLALKGRVVDASGKPVVGAIVSAEGCKIPDGQRWWGTVDHVDPLSISNARGEFLMVCSKPTSAIDLRIEARGLATKNFQLVPVGAEERLTLTEGATVTGKVLGTDGKPLANIMVGIVQEDRRCEVYTGHQEIGTNDRGEFSFVNLGPEGDWVVYGIMTSVKDHGAAIAATKVRVDGDGTTTDAGEIRAAKGFRLAGQVVLSDGKPVPAGTRIIVDRDRAWDSQLPTLDAEGRFDVSGIPGGELIGVDVSVPGYHLSRKNVSLDRMNMTGLEGLVDRDITDLRILMEPGPVQRPQSSDADWNEVSEQWSKLRSSRIAGAPTTAVGSAAR
jgi:protocatechuate 3,4-dioxygenase beta subunit